MRSCKDTRLLLLQAALSWSEIVQKNVAVYSVLTEIAACMQVGQQRAQGKYMSEVLGRIL